MEELWERAPTAEKDSAGGFLEEGRLLDDMVFEVLIMPSLRVTLDIVVFSKSHYGGICGISFQYEICSFVSRRGLGLYPRCYDSSPLWRNLLDYDMLIKQWDMTPKYGRRGRFVC